MVDISHLPQKSAKNVRQLVTFSVTITSLLTIGGFYPLSSAAAATTPGRDLPPKALARVATPVTPTNPPPSPRRPQCSNGIDDDGDGRIDAADAGCYNSLDNREADPCNDQYKLLFGIERLSPSTVSGSAITTGQALMVYEGDVGEFPRLPGSDWGEHNGGAPINWGQENWSRYLSSLEEGIRYRVPENFNGYVVLDYENLGVVLDEFSGAQAAYSQQIIRARTGLAGDALRQRAELEWFDATRQFYLATIIRAKQLRPLAKWSFYGLPGKRYYRYQFYRNNPQRRLWNDMMWEIYGELDFIAPEIYLETPLYSRFPGGYVQSVAANTDYIVDIIGEARRIARDSFGQPIIPIVSTHYNNRSLNWPLVRSPVDLDRQLFLPYRLGAAGVFIWGNSVPPYVTPYPGYIRNDVLPQVRRFCGLGPLR